MQWMPENQLGLYISVPFCRSKCTYCNFASGVYPASDHARYVDRLIQDMAGAGDWASRFAVDLPRSVDTVNLGGGTPSLLAPELIQTLFAALRAHFHLLPDAEITVECAPGQLAQPTLDALVAAGVNRVSLGVQSFIDAEAHSSGRLHNRAMVLHDLRRLRAAGIRNLNIDLIAGLANQTFSSWNESLTVLVDTGVSHASVYMLEVDEDSRLGRELLAGGVRYRAGLVPSDDAIVRMYETAIEQLASAGLIQYEISNFARPGAESRHNLRYWLRRPYLGLGLDASSMLPEAGGARILRATTSDDLKTYLAGPAEPAGQWLDLATRHEEAWFLGLRLNSGVDPEELTAEFGREMVAPTVAVAGRLVSEGLLETSGSRFRLTSRGRLLSNEVFERFLDIAPEPSQAVLAAG